MENPKGYANPQLLIAPGELHALAGHPRRRQPERPLVIDIRPAEQFAAGHVPGAIHIDLFGLSLIDTDPAPLKAFLWMIEHLFASRGVAADRPVVVYDDQSGNRAARAFWFLEFFGQPTSACSTAASAPGRARAAVHRDAEAPVATEWQGARRTEILATCQDVLDRLDKQRRRRRVISTRAPWGVLRHDWCAPRAAARFRAPFISSG